MTRGGPIRRRHRRLSEQALALWLYGAVCAETVEAIHGDLIEEWASARRQGSAGIRPAVRLAVETLCIGASLRREQWNAWRSRRRPRMDPGSHAGCHADLLHNPGIGGNMKTIAQDIRYALRVVRRRPLATAIIIVMLAVGVGANAAIFSVVNGVVLRPLTFPDPDRIVVVLEENVSEEMLRQAVSPPKLDDWTRQATVFERLAAYASTTVGISGDFDPETVPAAAVTDEIFEILGIVPVLGRPFQTEEYLDGSSGVAVVSDSLWRRKFAADPRLVGKSVQLNQVPHRIVGVLPPVDDDVGLGDILLPYAEHIDNREIHFLNVLGRLREDVTHEQAQREMDGIAARLAGAYPSTDAGWTITLVSLHDQLVGDVSGALMMMLGAVGVVLLIACVNVVHLLLAGTEERRAEIALRISLGAGRSRIVRQLLTESTVLGAAGAIAAVLMGHWALQLLLAAAPADLLRRHVPALDVWVLGFGITLSIAATVLVGLVPALRYTRPAAAYQGALARSRGVLRPALLVAEVALASVLVVGAGLLVRSFATLTAVDPGFISSGVLTARVSLPAEQFPDDADVRLFADQLLERAAALPGVNAAEISNSIPLTGGPWFNIESVMPAEDSVSNAGPGPMRVVTPGYMAALGIELVAGRDFAATDVTDSPSVIILDEGLAHRLFPADDALGQRVRTYYAEPQEREVIGIVGGVKQWGLNGMTSAGFYLPLEQVRWSTLYVVVQTQGNPNDVAAELRRVVWSLAPDVPVDNVGTMEQMLRSSLGQPRFRTLLLSLFGGMSLLLAIGGIAGVTLQSVGSRRGEIGIRMALGARGRDIVRMVVRESMKFVAIGLACGMVLSYFAVRLISALLFQTESLDAATFATVAVVVSVVAGLASWLPARRAAAVDPLIVIRGD